MTEEEFMDDLLYGKYSPMLGHDRDFAEWIYAHILRHLVCDVIDPRTTAKDIIFTLEQRIKDLEENK